MKTGPRHPWAYLAVCAAALLLDACTVGPDYHRPEIAAPPAFSEAATTAHVAITPAEEDISTWWTAFNDPVLNDLMRRALADNPDLQIAASRVREARAGERVSAAAGLPTINGTGNALTFNSNRKGASGAAGAPGIGLDIPSHTNLYAVGFDASWEVDVFGGVRRSVEAARANTEAAEWSRRDGQVSLLAEIANDYLTLRALQARIAIGQAELQRQKDIFGLIHDRRVNGFVTNLDVNQQSGEVDTAAAQIPELTAEAAAQAHALAVLVGQPPETLRDDLRPVETALPAPPPVLAVGLPSDLLRRRPDIREAERRVAAANATIGTHVADLYPKLNLLGLASFASNSVDGLVASDNLQSIAAGLVTVPIFNAGKTRAQIREAREEEAQALLTYRKTILGSFRDVEDALARYKAEDDRRAALAQAVKASADSLAIAVDEYRAGTVTFINVLNAENALLQSRDQLTQSDAQTLTDLVSLYKTLGGGWSVSGDDTSSRGR